MEVDRILYIFGSFTRKKDKRKSFDQSSISAGNSPLHLKVRPTSHNIDIAPRTSAYEVGRRKSRVKEWECGLCKREVVEPRILACLHSFCTRCLQGLHREGEAAVWKEVDEGSSQLEPDSGTASGAGSVGSSYDSDLRHSGSDASWDQAQRKYGIFTRKVSGKSAQFLLCPTCGNETPLPLGGIAALPLNYLILRKMAAAEQDGDLKVLCDLCSTDNKAESKCTQCLVSVCGTCKEAHRRARATSRHSLHPLDPAAVKYCSIHPRAELCVYCATCQMVVCRDCCIISHSGHALANASLAAGERARILRDACERTRQTPHHIEALRRHFDMKAREFDAQAACIEAEIESWTQQYKRAVEAHGRALAAAAARARCEHRQRVDARERALRERAKVAVEAVEFAEELVSGSEHEVLSLGGLALRRLERAASLAALARPPRGTLRFLPRAPATGDPTLVGAVVTRAPDPSQCVLWQEGLQDLRVDSPHEAILELRDSNGEKIWCGGEEVAGYLRRRDCGSAPARARVRPRADGACAVLLRAPAPGNYLLAVTVDNAPVQGSPFPVSVRKRAAHGGRWQCCGACAGAARAPCGCRRRPNTDCSHAQPGWPGKHWSCCGSTVKKGPCQGTNNTLYHVSL